MELQDLKSPQTVEFIAKLENLTALIKTAFNCRTPHLNGEKYLTNKDMTALLHMSIRTLQDLRDTGKLSYIQISGKILYKESDILKLLEDNYYAALNQHDW